MSTAPIDPTIAAHVREDVAATLARADDHWVLVLRRRMPQAVDALWSSLTAPGLLARWSPVVPDRVLDSPGPATTRENPGDEAVDATVLAVDPPRLLEHRWGAGRLRWTLATSGGGTELELRQLLGERAQAPDLAAGWRICLATLAAGADGVDRERVVGRRSYDYGWRGLRDGYARTLGEG